MSRRMLVGLIVPVFLCYAFGSGVLPLFPLYAIKVGASPAVAGWCIAFSFFCLAAGALLVGRIGATLRRRTFLIALMLLDVPLIVFMGRAVSVWQLAVLTGIVWFSGGCLLTGINIIASRHAGEAERGRIFGMIGVAIRASSIAGGLAIGTTVDRWGYPAMFAAVAVYWPLIPLALALLLPSSVERLEVPGEGRPTASAGIRIGSGALLLVVAQFIASAASGADSLGRSLTMNVQGYSATEITSTVVVGSLVTLPAPFILGRLSDRIGRKTVLFACFACGSGSLVMLIVSRTLWQFWAFGVLLAALEIGSSIASAFIADLVPPARVGSALSLIHAAMYLGTVVGMSTFVPVASVIGMRQTLAAIAVVAAIDAVLILFVRRPRTAASVTPR